MVSNSIPRLLFPVSNLSTKLWMGLCLWNAGRLPMRKLINVLLQTMAIRSSRRPSRSDLSVCYEFYVCVYLLIVNSCSRLNALLLNFSRSNTHFTQAAWNYSIGSVDVPSDESGPDYRLLWGDSEAMQIPGVVRQTIQTDRPVLRE